MTDCLNFGSPEDPDVMWQFAEATRGLAEGCRTLGIPVTGGNVSFYNQTGDVAILPTPVVGVLGVIDDVTRRTPIGFSDEGQQIYLLGDDARRARRLGVGDTSCTATSVGCRRSSTSPPSAELADISDQRLARRTDRRGPRPVRRRAGPGVWSSRACGTTSGPASGCPTSSTRSSRCSASRRPARVVAVPRSEEVRFTDMCSARGFAHARIGVTDGRGPDAVLDVQDQFTVSLAELRAAWSATLPAASPEPRARSANRPTVRRLRRYGPRTSDCRTVRTRWAAVDSSAAAVLQRSPGGGPDDAVGVEADVALVAGDRLRWCLGVKMPVMATLRSVAAVSARCRCLTRSETEPRFDERRAARRGSATPGLRAELAVGARSRLGAGSRHRPRGRRTSNRLGERSPVWFRAASAGTGSLDLRACCRRDRVAVGARSPAARRTAVVGRRGRPDPATDVDRR